MKKLSKQNGREQSLKNQQKENKKAGKICVKVLLVVCVLFAALFCSALTYFTVLYNKYDLDILKLTSVNNGIKVYSASGQDNTLYNSNRTITELESLPPYVLKAFVDIEDKRFYQHNGYDFKRILKAGVINLTSKSKSQGASTISQQLIKNALLSNEKTYERKVKEIILAIKMEKKFSKNEILEMYLNTIYFGQNAYGIENAARVYFNKQAQDLTLSEACCLAGLIKSPAKYSPKTNYTNSIERRNVVAKAMLSQKDISQTEFESVVNSEIEIAPTASGNSSYEREAIYEACSLLNITERELINRDYEIITNKDDELQANVVKSNKNVLSSAQELFNENLDSVSIVADNDGRILAYYCNSNYNLHNVKRQPASLIKPIAVYLPCFKYNILSPATLLLDEPINYNGFSPNNAGGGFAGYISVRNAVAQSTNIPAVKALDYLGLNKAQSTLADFGINLTAQDLNLSLALGALSKGVGFIQLTNAYTTIANMGEYRPLTFINKILDKDGNVVYTTQQYSEKVMDDASCFLMTDCLKETVKSGTAKRLNDLPYEIASKTGTAYNGQANTDLFNVAYTSKHTALTWIADIKNNALDNHLHSSNQPTEINKRIFEKLYSSQRPAAFTCPDDIVRAAYDINEYETNHSIVAPMTNVERYIAYDYFKADNLPEIKQVEPTTLDIQMDKTGSYIYFDAIKSNHYSLIKACGDSNFILESVMEKNGKIEIKDSDIFKHNEITYSLVCNEEIVATAKIRPKEYLLNLIEQQMLNGKSRWFV